MDRSKILLVDDEEDILEAIRFRLEQEGYEVVTGVNGYEAMGAAKLARPDLILLDVMLPKENGYRVSKAIREDEEKILLGRRTPILLMTARDLSTDTDREKMFMDFSDADDVIYKPFEMDELVQRVREFLNSVGKGTPQS